MRAIEHVEGRREKMQEARSRWAPRGALRGPGGAVRRGLQVASGGPGGPVRLRGTDYPYNQCNHLRWMWCEPYSPRSEEAGHPTSEGR